MCSKLARSTGCLTLKRVHKKRVALATRFTLSITCQQTGSVLDHIHEVGIFAVHILTYQSVHIGLETGEA